MRAARSARGFTLVELLVVIAIIGILVGLLMPAVQAAREAGRRTQCMNNLKNISLAWQQHHTQFEWFPTGGWAYAWTGDPDRGFGAKQPGGWVFNILPFVEQDALYHVGAGKTFAEKKSTYFPQRDSTPLAVFTCPTRRPTTSYVDPCCGANNADLPGREARSCYAANVGDSTDVTPLLGGNFTKPPPGSLVEGDTTYPWPDTSQMITGVSFFRSQIGVAHISDGASNTYAVGEKYINADHYLDGKDGGDDWSMYTGHQEDIYRSTRNNGSEVYAPMQDMPNVDAATSFGSAHSGTFNMAFCDGSVHSISYTIDPETHRRLGNRKDGLVVDASKF